MKKLTAGIFATLLAVVSVGAAHAEIASKGYVDQQVDTVEATVANKADSATVTALAGRVDTAEGEIEDERFAWFFNMDPIEGAEAYSSEALISAVPHSIALLRVPEGTDVETVAKQIEENANPRKWVCVEAEKTIVKTRGNVVLLVMSDAATADQVAANFEAYA